MAGTTWQLDPAHTMVEFAVKHMMVSTVRGRFRAVRGMLELADAYPGTDVVEVEIEAASIDTGVADRDAHLRSADFFDVENHPLLTFRGERRGDRRLEVGESFELPGTLTIRGTSLPVTLQAEFVGQGGDVGEVRVGFEARTAVDRRDYGLRWNQALETGGILVANEVKIELDVQAMRQSVAERTAA